MENCVVNYAMCKISSFKSKKKKKHKNANLLTVLGEIQSSEGGQKRSWSASLSKEEKRLFNQQCNKAKKAKKLQTLIY